LIEEESTSGNLTQPSYLALIGDERVIAECLGFMETLDIAVQESWTHHLLHMEMGIVI
jgi:hypothetical protein